LIKDNNNLKYINGCKPHLTNQFCEIELDLKSNFLTNIKGITYLKLVSKEFPTNIIGHTSKPTKIFLRINS